MRPFQIIFIVAFIFTSCKKNEIFNPTSDSLNAVYIAGTVKSNSKDVAAIWKNGKLILMSDSLTQNATISSIYVTNRHVYACGFSTKGNNISAFLWKDGIMTNLADTSITSNATSVFATENDDIYVSGWDCKYGPANAVIWINGKETFLTNTPTPNFGLFYQAWATKVYVANNVCYISGFESIGGKSTAKIWENGVLTNLTDGSNMARANAVFASGKDIYVAGFEYSNNYFSIAKIWKNKIPIPISDITPITTNNYHSANAFDVFVVDQDVYVAGNESDSKGSYLKIWKNSIASILNTNVYNNNYAEGMYVSGNDIYIAGTVGHLNTLNNSNIACFWKNGVLNILPDFLQGSSAKAVFVKN